MRRLAYQTEDDFGDGEVVRFLSEQEAADYPDAQRKPDFDRYEPCGAVPCDALYAAGWTFRCMECGKTVGQGYEEEGDHHILGRDEAFCSVACARCDRADAAEMHAARAEALRAAFEKFPHAWPHKSFIGGVGECGCFKSDRFNAVVELRFPGSKTHNNHYCHGCGVVWVCNGDRDAWRAAKEGE